MLTVYDPGVTNPIPLGKLFVRPAVLKPGTISTDQAIKPDTAGEHSPSYQPKRATTMYQAAEIANERHPVLKASQIMTTPVVSVQAHSSVLEALNVLSTQLSQAER